MASVGRFGKTVRPDVKLNKVKAVWPHISFEDFPPLSELGAASMTIYELSNVGDARKGAVLLRESEASPADAEEIKDDDIKS